MMPVSNHASNNDDEVGVPTLGSSQSPLSRHLGRRLVHSMCVNGRSRLELGKGECDRAL